MKRNTSSAWGTAALLPDPHYSWCRESGEGESSSQLSHSARRQGSQVHTHTHTITLYTVCSETKCTNLSPPLSQILPLHRVASGSLPRQTAPGVAGAWRVDLWPFVPSGSVYDHAPRHSASPHQRNPSPAQSWDSHAWYTAWILCDLHSNHWFTAHLKVIVFPECFLYVCLFQVMVCSMTLCVPLSWAPPCKWKAPRGCSWPDRLTEQRGTRKPPHR